jgi:hypothetical protein
MPTMIKAFLLGIYEFKSDFTTNFDHVETDKGYAFQQAYEMGKDLAHKFTFRHFDSN